MIKLYFLRHAELVVEIYLKKTWTLTLLVKLTTFVNSVKIIFLMSTVLWLKKCVQSTIIKSSIQKIMYA